MPVGAYHKATNTICDIRGTAARNRGGSVALSGLPDPVSAVLLDERAGGTGSTNSVCDMRGAAAWGIGGAVALSDLPDSVSAF